MKKIEMGGYKRISKAAARKLHARGAEVFICWNIYTPVSPWGSPLFSMGRTRTFEQTLNEFTYYGAGLGSSHRCYPAFYIKTNA